MYCKNCNLHYDDKFEICPNCNQHLNFDDEEMKQKKIIEKIEEVKLRRKFKKANYLMVISIFTIVIHEIISIFVQMKIQNYYDTSSRFLPFLITLCVYLAFLKRAEEIHTFKNNLFFMLFMIIISIIVTMFISVPLANNVIFKGDYLYNEYWILYGIGLFLILIEGVFLIFDDSYHIAYSKYKIDYKVTIYILVMGLVIIFIIVLINSFNYIMEIFK